MYPTVLGVSGVSSVLFPHGYCAHVLILTILAGPAASVSVWGWTLLIGGSLVDEVRRADIRWGLVVSLTSVMRVEDVVRLEWPLIGVGLPDLVG